MMRQMRENTKIIMLATALAFVALMVFQWGMDVTGRSLGSNELGRVNGTPVTNEQYQLAYRNVYDQVQQSQEEPITSQQNRQIEDQAWDQVVNQILIQEELARRGIQVTDEEIRQAARFSPPPDLRQSPAFQTDGRFDLQKYQQFLSSPQVDNNLLLQLESYYRDVIPRGKLLRQVSSGVYVTDAELWQAYRDRNEKVRVRFMPMNPAQRIADDSVTVDDDEIEAYYREHRDDEFAVPARASVQVAVLPKAPLASDSTAALERAREAYRRVTSGGEDFAAVAREMSSDSASARRGGELGWFTRGQMVPAFEEAAFSASEGSVTEPVKSQFGYHVIQVEEKQADSVKARHILVPVERTEDSEIRLLTLADSLEALGEDRTLGEAASALGLETRTVRINEDFPIIQGVGQVGEGADWVFEEAQIGDVSPVFETRQSFYALQLESLQPAGFQSRDEARPTILETLRFQKKLARAAEEAERYVQELRSGRDFEDVAVEHDLEIREPEPFARTDFVPGMGRMNAAVGTAFGLDEGEISDAVQTAQNAFIIQLVERIPADSAAWAEQKEDQRQQRMRQIEQQRLQQWLQALRDKAEIVDRREEVFRAAEEAAQNPQPFSGGRFGS